MEDRELAAALVKHPKERAEHIMLIDLARNDLGRVATGGSVRVDEYMAVETYAHVHHIVSNVAGELRAGISPVEALRAVFPGGTITGVRRCAACRSSPSWKMHRVVRIPAVSAT